MYVYIHICVCLCENRLALVSLANMKKQDSHMMQNKTIENNIDFLWELMNSKLDNDNCNLTSSRVMGKKCCGVFD